MSDPFLGEIRMFGGNFAPRGWALCNGQLLAIASNSALFSLLGTTYGGDGRTTFALPDLRGRAPIHEGTGPGLSPRVLGQTGGTEQLASTMMPEHAHDLYAATGAASSGDPGLKVMARSRLSTYASGGQTTPMANTAITGSGSNSPSERMPPYTAINYIIALVGIFPSRS